MPDSHEKITKDVPKCRCGYTADHHMVSAEGVYTLTGKFWVLFGVTTAPVAIKYRCRVCGQLIAETKNPDVLKKDV